MEINRMLGSDSNKNENQIEYLLENAHIELGNKQFDTAITLFNQALQLKNADASIYNNIGVIYYLKEEFTNAVKYFNQALEIDPTYFDVNLNLAKTFIKIENQPKAIKYTQKCLWLEPDNSKATQLLTKITTHAFQKSIYNIPLLEKTNNPLKILFIQDSPCIRNYKMATALGRRGHQVTLAYTRYKLSEMYKDLDDNVYKNLIHLDSHKQLWDIVSDFDIVHCHNEPDILTVAALAGNTPVVHDTHDLISLRAGDDPNLKYFEGVANRGAAGRVYTTIYQLEEAKKLYGIKGPSIVYNNFASFDDLPAKFLPKLSKDDHCIHIVYEGGIGGNTHRDFIDLFLKLAQGNIHIHIYPTFFYSELESLFCNYSNIHYYPTLSPKEIIMQMTQYDVGIIPFNLEKGNKRFLDSTIANKLYEYLAAGLPVLTSNLESYQDFFNKYPVGMTFNQITDLKAKLVVLIELASKIDFSKYIFTYETQITHLENLYNSILIKNKSDNKAFLHNIQKSPVCKICHNTNTKLINHFHDTNIFTCLNCETEFSHPLAKTKSKAGKNLAKNKETDFVLNSVNEQELNYGFYNSFLIESFNITGNGHVLEIGCYDGRFLKKYKDLGYNCIGIDDCKDLLQYGIEQYGLQLECGILADFYFDSNYFDIIICHQKLHTLKKPVKFLLEINRILKNDGVLLLSVPNHGSLKKILENKFKKGFNGHEQANYFFNKSSLAFILNKSGFSSFKVKSYPHVNDSLNVYFSKQTTHNQQEQPDEHSKFLIDSNLKYKIIDHTEIMVTQVIDNMVSEYGQKLDELSGLMVIAKKNISRIDEKIINNFYKTEKLEKTNDSLFKNHNLIIDLSRTIVQLYKWFKLEGSVGYHQEDIDSFVLQNRLSVTMSKSELDSLANDQHIYPIESRIKLGINKTFYPDAFGLLLSSLAKIPLNLKDIKTENQIQYSNDILSKQIYINKFGTGWGFPFDRFIIDLVPGGTPDALTTCIVGEAYWEHYKITNSQSNLDICVKIACYLFNSLNRIIIKDDLYMFTLTSVGKYTTFTSNMVAAEYIYLIGIETENKEWISVLEKAVLPTLDNIMESGLVEKHPSTLINEKLLADAVHLDYVLQLLALQNLYKISKNEIIRKKFKQLFDFYLSNYFFENRIPIEIYASDKSIDTFTLGFILVLLVRTFSSNIKAAKILFNLLPEIFQHFINPDGSFINSFFQVNKNLYKDTFPFYLRNQASMLNGFFCILNNTESIIEAWNSIADQSTE